MSPFVLDIQAPSRAADGLPGGHTCIAVIKVASAATEGGVVGIYCGVEDSDVPETFVGRLGAEGEAVLIVVFLNLAPFLRARRVIFPFVKGIGCRKVRIEAGQREGNEDEVTLKHIEYCVRKNFLGN